MDISDVGIKQTRTSRRGSERNASDELRGSKDTLGPQCSDLWGACGSQKKKMFRREWKRRPKARGKFHNSEPRIRTRRKAWRARRARKGKRDESVWLSACTKASPGSGPDGKGRSRGQLSKRRGGNRAANYSIAAAEAREASRVR